MLTAIFARHGEADYGNDGLTENGKTQAKELGYRLKREFSTLAGFELHISSAGRTRETAGILLGDLACSYSLVTDELLFRARASYVQGDAEHSAQAAQELLMVSHRGQIEANVRELCGRDIFQNSIPGLSIPEGREHLEPDLNTAEAVILRFEGENWAERGLVQEIEVLRREL